MKVSQGIGQIKEVHECELSYCDGLHLRGQEAGGASTGNMTVQKDGLDTAETWGGRELQNPPGEQDNHSSGRVRNFRRQNLPTAAGPAALSMGYGGVNLAQGQKPGSALLRRAEQEEVRKSWTPARE